jgi:hypothetical protein
MPLLTQRGGCRYLTRTIELAKRANSGVDNVSCPALLLIGNKLPGEEIETCIETSTRLDVPVSVVLSPWCASRSRRLVVPQAVL